MTVYGIGTPNGPLHDGELDRILELGLRDYVVLDAQLDQVPTILARQPDARIHLRIDRRGAFDAKADAKATVAILRNPRAKGIATVRCRNEPQLESPGTTPLDWYKYLVAYVNAVKEDCPDAEIYVPAPSPGTPDFEQWLARGVQAAFSADFAGVDCHAYGWQTEIAAVLKTYREHWPGKLLVTEYNFGAGRLISDLSIYAAEMPSILALFRDANVDAVCWFIYRWVNPDTHLQTPVDVAGTPIERALKEGKVPTPMPQPMKYARGVDLSNNNGAVDVPLLAQCIDFAFFKASEGTTFRDDYFGSNWYAAGVAQLARGAYHFGRPSANSGHAEAMFFLDQLTRNGINRGDVLALDLEEDEKTLPATADLLAYTLDFMRTIYGALGFRPLLYSRTSYLAAHNCLGNPELGQYGLWLADYQTRAFPATPAGWPFVAAWQYGQGAVPGVKGDADFDVFAGTVDQFRKYGKP